MQCCTHQETHLINKRQDIDSQNLQSSLFIVMISWIELVPQAYIHLDIDAFRNCIGCAPYFANECFGIARSASVRCTHIQLETFAKCHAMVGPSTSRLQSHHLRSMFYNASEFRRCWYCFVYNIYYFNCYGA